MDLDIKWPRQLSRRNGSPSRLAGVTVYYDFDWVQVFGNNKAQFPKGQRLAHLLKGDCPPGKIPALLLTDLPDMRETVIDGESHFLMIVNVKRYMTSSADPAVTYLATKLPAPITALSRQELSSASADDLAWLLDQRLNSRELFRWASANSARREMLASVLGALEEAEPASPPPPPSQQDAPPTPSMVASLLVRLGTLEQPILDAICHLLNSDLTADDYTRIARVLTESPLGRRQAMRVIGQQISERISDTRHAIHLYKALLSSPDTIETDFQRLLEEYPWLIGLDYVEVRPLQDIPRGTLDFIIKRYDGFHDLIELKDPQAPIISINPRAGENPSPSEYSLSPALAQALAQSHAYRDTLTTDEATVDRLYGLRWTRNPRLIILIGRVGMLSEGQKRILEQINLSLHRVEIVPYDLLASRVEVFISNVERYLASPDATTPPRTASVSFHDNLPEYAPEKAG